MRRKSRLETDRENGRSYIRRYLFFGALALLSLALPAALTLLGSGRPPASPPGASYEGNGAAGGVGASGGDGGDGSSWARPSDLDPVSSLEWRGIGGGIASVPTSVDDMHVVFSTDCSPYQNYQSVLLFHSAEVGATGHRCPV